MLILDELDCDTGSPYDRWLDLTIRGNKALEQGNFEYAKLLLDEAIKIRVKYRLWFWKNHK